MRNVLVNDSVNTLVSLIVSHCQRSWRQRHRLSQSSNNGYCIVFLISPARSLPDLSPAVGVCCATPSNGSGNESSLVFSLQKSSSGHNSPLYVDCTAAK